MIKTEKNSERLILTMQGKKIEEYLVEKEVNIRLKAYRRLKNKGADKDPTDK